MGYSRYRHIGIILRVRYLKKWSSRAAVTIPPAVRTGRYACIRSLRGLSAAGGWWCTTVSEFQHWWTGEQFGGMYYSGGVGRREHRWLGSRVTSCYFSLGRWQQRRARAPLGTYAVVETLSVRFFLSAGCLHCIAARSIGTSGATRLRCRYCDVQFSNRRTAVAFPTPRPPPVRFHKS